MTTRMPDYSRLAIVLATELGLASAPLCRAMETTASSLDGTPGPITVNYFMSKVDIGNDYSRRRYLVTPAAFAEGAVSEATLYRAAAMIARSLKFSPVAAAHQGGHLAVLPIRSPGSHAILISLHPEMSAHDAKVVSIEGHPDAYLNIRSGAYAVDRYMQSNDPAVFADVFDGLRSDPGVDAHEARAVLDSAANAALYSEMQSRWIPDAAVARRTGLYSIEHGCHIGVVPAELAVLLGSQEEAFKTLDHVANELGFYMMENGRYLGTPKEPHEVAARLPFGISRLSEGKSGLIYRLHLPTRDLVLKVFIKGPGHELEEFRALTFFGAQGAWNIMKAYAAKLSMPRAPFLDNVPWILSELVPRRLSPEERAARGQSSVEAIIAAHHLDIDVQNQGTEDWVGGVLMDAGFLSSHDKRNRAGQRANDWK